MFKRLLSFFSEWRARKRLGDSIAPETISGLAVELQRLVDLVSHMERGRELDTGKLKLIQEEMNKVINLCAWPAFKNLPADTRLQLRSSILNTRRETLEAVTKHYPAASTRMQ